MLDDIRNYHRRINAGTSDKWTAFQFHRERVTALLLSSEPSGEQRLCVLGAGNCNDLDLPVLTGRFGEIHLVDLDGEALVSGIERQDCSGNPKIHYYAGIDLSGFERFPTGVSANKTLEDQFITGYLSRSEPIEIPDMPGGFDVVASTCLLTQLFATVDLCIGEKHAHYADVIFKLRQHHIQMMYGLLRPGGMALLICDCVSSDTAPDLATVPPDRLQQRLTELINVRNFFSGTNPVVLGRMMGDSSQTGFPVSQCDIVAPWLWACGTRTYAVYAVRAVKADGAVNPVR